MALEFTQQFLDDFVADNTNARSVILIYCNDLAGKAKDKILVIVSKSLCNTKFGCILINSDNYPKINNSHYLKSLQIKALALKYPNFLKHDSFFDCSDIRESQISEIDAILKKDAKRMLGKIDIEDHNLICEALRNNKKLTPKTKRLYYLN